MSVEVEGGGSPPVVLKPVSVPETGGLRLRQIMFAIGVIAVLFWLGATIGLWLVTLSIVFLVAAAIGAAVVLVRRGAAQEESLLWALSVASEKGMPLAPAALAFSDQFGRSFRWRVRLLAALLEEGKTLPEALDLVPGLLSREANLFARTGWAAGTLPAGLRDAATVRNDRRAAWGSASGRLAYVVALLFVMQIIVSFMFYFIVPKIEAIFRDFGVALPAVTVKTLEVSHAFTSAGGIPALLFVVLELLAVILVPLGLFNALQWDVPLIDVLMRRRHASLLMRALALWVDGSRPIEAGLSNLAEEYPSGWVRRRLRKAAEHGKGGVHWADALVGVGALNESDAALLRSSQRAGNLAWGLREASAAADRRFGYRVQVALQTVFTLLIMTVGAFVFVFAVAFFLPLVTLIERLA